MGHHKYHDDINSWGGSGNNPNLGTKNNPSKTPTHGYNNSSPQSTPLNVAPTDDYTGWNWEQILNGVLGLSLPSRDEVTGLRWTVTDENMDDDHSLFKIFGAAWDSMLDSDRKDFLVYLNPGLQDTGGPWDEYLNTPANQLAAALSGAGGNWSDVAVDPKDFASIAVALEGVQDFYLNASDAFDAITSGLKGEAAKYKGAAGEAFYNLMSNFNTTAQSIYKQMVPSGGTSYATMVSNSGTETFNLVVGLWNAMIGWITTRLDYSPLGAIFQALMDGGIVQNDGNGNYSVTQSLYAITNNPAFGNLLTDDGWLQVESAAKQLWLDAINGSLDQVANPLVLSLANTYLGTAGITQPLNPPAISQITPNNVNDNFNGNFNQPSPNFHFNQPPPPSFHFNQPPPSPSPNFNGLGNGIGNGLNDLGNFLGKGFNDLGGGLNGLGGGLGRGLNGLGADIGGLGGGLNGLGAGLGGGLNGLGGGLGNLGSMLGGGLNGLGGGLGGGLNGLGADIGGLGGGLNGLGAGLGKGFNDLGGGLNGLGGGLNGLGGGLGGGLNGLGGGLGGGLNGLGADIGGLGGGLNGLGAGLGGGLNGLGGGLNGLGGGLGGGLNGLGADIGGLGGGIGNGLNALRGTGALGSNPNVLSQLLSNPGATSALQTALGDTQAEQQALEHALALAPSSGPLHSALENALATNGQAQHVLESALAGNIPPGTALQTALGDNSKVQSALNRALSSGQVPSSGPLRASLQQALGDNTNTGQALKHALSASVPGGSSIEQALTENGKLQSALRHALASGQVPTTGPLHNVLEKALADSGKAKAALDQALASGGAPEAASIQQALADNKAAQAELQKALTSSLVPKSGPLHNELANALADTRDMGKALHQALTSAGIAAEAGKLSTNPQFPEAALGELAKLFGGGKGLMASLGHQAGLSAGLGAGGSGGLSATTAGGGLASGAGAPLSSGRFVAPQAQPAVGGGGAVPFYPPMAGMGMGNPGGQQGTQERERTTWLSEDEDVWGTEPTVGRGFIGRDFIDEGDDLDDFDECFEPADAQRRSQSRTQTR